MQDFFSVVREACSPQTWSRGVELVRAGSVSGDRDEGSEVHLRVATRGGLISPTVVLYLDDEDWECSCSGPEEPCEHIAASTIALRQARKQGGALPTPRASSGRIRYCFRRENGTLSLQREIVTEDVVHPLTTTLDAIASGRVDGPRFAADQRDLRAEIVIGSQRNGPLSRGVMERLIDCLADCNNVLLDGEPVSISSERALPRARLTDAEGGFRLRLLEEASITERFANDAVLCGDTLRMKGQARLTGRELQDLPAGRFYSDDQVAELVTEVLPGLESRIALEMETEKLPTATTAERPRIAIAVERSGDELCVLATLVYGDPPSARIDAGDLVHLSGPIPVRNRTAERQELRNLRAELGVAPGQRVRLRGGVAIEFAERLARWRGDIAGSAHDQFYRAAPLEASFEASDAGFEVFFLPSEADGERAAGSRQGARAGVSSDAVLAAWKTGESLVGLPGGGFAELPEDWLTRYGHRVSGLLAARDERGEVPTSALPALAQLCDDLDEPRPLAFDRLAPLLEGFEGIPRAELPADLQATLRDYQGHGIDWLCFLRDAGLGGLLADDMGLGKTLQALCAISGRSLVVAPTSVLQNWVEEAARFRPKLRVNLYHGASRSLEGDHDVVLTSYALLRLDRAILCAESWQTCVLDEAQNIKNPDSQVAQAAYRLDADFRIALTGTPVENRLDELWSQLHFTNPGLLGGRSDFRDRSSRRISDGDSDAAAELRDRIRPFVLRRLKRDVAPELPPRTDIVLHVELDPEEREVYDSVRAATLQNVVEQLRAGGSVMAALEALLRLRQAACHAGLVPGQHAESSSKIDALVDRLEQAVDDGHRALVFSQWTGLLDRIEPHLRAANLDFSRLDGSTRNRGDVVAAFQAGEDSPEQGTPIMLVSLKAGGTGLNLTAADHIFLMDPWWNPAVEDQAADRAHRIGQSRPVLVHRIVARETVEEQILVLHKAKRALSEMALEDAGQSGGLTRDDLLHLLEGA